jgi:hypothetical protein
MRSRELIERLQECDPNAEVYFSCDYGDITHTQQLLPVAEVIVDLNTGDICDSAYSQSGEALRDDAMDDDDEDARFDAEDIVVLQ